MDKLLAMTTFVEIVNQGSLTGASKTLNKSLPSIVRTLANLEQSLQVRLLNRSTRKMALTEEGRVYYKRCQQILCSVEEAESEVGDNPLEPTGIITMSAPVPFGQMHVAPALIRFSEQYPKIQATLLLDNRYIDLLEEEVDLSLRIGYLADSSMIAIPVGQIERVLCATPGLLERIGTPTHPNELPSLPCVGYGRVHKGIFFYFKQNQKNLDVPISGPICSDNVLVNIQACLAGTGIGQFYSYQVDHLIKQGKLIKILEDFQIDPIPVNLIYPQNKLLSNRVRVFLDWMKKELRSAL